MTRRQWVNSLSDEDFIKWVVDNWSRCNNKDTALEWLAEDYEEPVQIKESDTISFFKDKFRDRRVLSLDEVTSALKEVFEKCR